MPKPIKSAVIIDPNKYHAQTLAQALTQEGVNALRHYATAKEGLEGLLLLNPCVTFIEAELDGRDGVEFLREVRRNKAVRSRQGVMFLMASRASAMTLAQAADAGANSLIAKPIAPGAIGALIRKVWETPRPFIDAEGYVGPCRRMGVVAAPSPCPQRREDDRRRLREERLAVRAEALSLLRAAGPLALDGDGEALAQCLDAVQTLKDLALLLGETELHWIGHTVARALTLTDTARGEGDHAALFEALGVMQGEALDGPRRQRLSAYIQTFAPPAKASA